jgi:hypothetical protein
MDLGELTFQVDLAAALIAVVALVYSIRSGARQRRLERESLRLQRDSDIIAWSNACLAGLCQAEMLMRTEYATVTPEPEFERLRYETLAAISCAIDRGRMFFPNREHDKVGLDRETAFRGRRHPVLDRLVWVYDLLSDVTYRTPTTPEERQQIREQSIAHKRHFISEVQSEVDPRRRISFLERHG